MELNETFGGRISRMLSKNGMSQRELAEKIGVTEVSVNRYIHTGRSPKGSTIVGIARALHTTTDYLLGLEIDEDPEHAYFRTVLTLSKYAVEWTPKQKSDLVRMLFEVEKEDTGT